MCWQLMKELVEVMAGMAKMIKNAHQCINRPMKLVIVTLRKLLHVFLLPTIIFIVASILLLRIVVTQRVNKGRQTTLVLKLK